MERRTVLTALAAAPLAALGSTVHALGRRRRQCSDQPSYWEDMRHGVDTASLDIKPDTTMPGTYIVTIEADVSQEFVKWTNEERVTFVHATLLQPSGDPVPGFEDIIMARTSTAPNPDYGQGTYKVVKPMVMLTPTTTLYTARVRATIDRKHYGLSNSMPAP